MSGGTSEQIEVERKYAVGAEFVMPDLNGPPGVAAVTSPRTYHLTAIYFDTPGFRLASARITLRRRTGGTDAGWHLKLPAGAARREVHAPLESGTDTVPAELAGLVSDVTGGRPLRPIARLQTARTVRHLTDAAGRFLAEVADDQVTGSLPEPAGPDGPDGPGRDAAGTAESWREASAWREVEVELDHGTADLLDATGELLFAAGARPSPAASKLSLLLTTAGRLPASED
jgi:inorganic triphosphatase YgiF